MEQAGDRIGGDRHAELLQQLGDFAGSLMGPLEAGDRVSSGIVLQ